MVCAKCNQDITNVKESIRCVECNADLHVGCCRIRTAAKLAQMQPKSVAEWRCESCTSKSASGQSNVVNMEESQVIQILKSMQQEMSKNNAENKQSMENLEGVLSEIKSCIVGVQNKISVLEAENVKLRTTCESLSKDNSKLIKQVTSLQYDMDELQQYSRNQNLEIRNIPRTNNENVYSVLESVAKAIGVEYARSEISIAHRLQTPRGKNIPPAIVVQFVSRSTRSAWLSAAKRKHITAKDLSPALPSSPVFINEHLSSYNKMLLGRAKSMIRDGHLAYAWSRDGRILVRKTSDAAAVRVRSTDDICAVAGTSAAEKDSTNTSVIPSP